MPYQNYIPVVTASPVEKWQLEVDGLRAEIARLEGYRDNVKTKPEARQAIQPEIDALKVRLEAAERKLNEGRR